MSITIVVQPNVILTRIPNSGTVGIGAVVNLTCTVVSYPQSSVIFQQRISDGNVIQNYTQMGVIHAVGSYQVSSTSKFRFQDTDITGLSEFCCVAVNDFGDARECLSFEKIGKKT